MTSGDPTPIDDALAHLSRLTMAGTAPDKVTAAIGTMIAGWAGEADMDAATVQARIGQLWDSTTKDAAELEEQISDADGGDPIARGAARRVLAALRAATRALAAAHERF